MIHHRRAGVGCHENLVFQMRLEMVQQLASLRLALQVDERFAWLSELPLKQMTYFPGRVDSPVRPRCCPDMPGMDGLF